MNVLIFGAGYSGRAFGMRMASQGVAVSGTTRTDAKATDLALAGVAALIFDGETVTDELRHALANATHIVQSIAPDEAGDPVLRAADLTALAPKLEWVGYLSTVGVYGDHQGAWVKEETPCNPVSQRSHQRLAAEEQWVRFGTDHDLPVAILRLSGIYGPGRNPFVNLANGTARRIVKPRQVFNRIEVDDIAGALEFLARRKEGGIFNVTDDEPSPPQDVVAFAAGLMDVDVPPEIPFEGAELSPMARSFYGENKRVSNEKLTALGYRFQHPNYREALRSLWENGDWPGKASDVQSRVPPG